MKSGLLHTILFETPYPVLFLLTTGYFLLLYFGVGKLFSRVTDWLVQTKRAVKIVDKPVSDEQIHTEIRHSLVSILLFGLSSLPIIWLARNGWISFAPDTFFTIVIGLIILNAWNEIHFFIVHRLMHTPFFFRKVHHVHHRSFVPTVWSVYSFHWFEALLLSTVPLTILPWLPLSPIAVALYPLSSILINFSGHCNVRFGNGKGSPFRLFGTLHNEHHSKGRKHFGFITPIPDYIISLFTKSKP